MSNISVTQPYRKRRQYTPEFKAQLVAESQNPGASVSRIALDNDLNANLLRRWIKESKQSGQQPTPAVQKSNSIRIEIPQTSARCFYAVFCNDPH